MRMKSRWVLAGVVGLAAMVLNSCTTSTGSGTISGTGFMWITTQGDQMLSAYNINLSTGAAAQVGSAVATGAGPIAVAIAPANKAILVANRDDNTVSYYTFNSDGSLANPCPPPKSAGCNTIAAGPVAGTPVALAVDPSGKFLFVANQAKQSVFPPPNTPDTVAVFMIGSGGVLTSAGSFASTGNGPSALVASPTGNFLYVANRYTSTVSILSYDTTTGALTEDLGSPIPAGTNPAGLALSRCAGTTTTTTNCPTAALPAYLLVANEGSNDISIFSACIQVTTTCPSANGTLTQLGPTVGSSGTHPVSFIIDPALDFVYAVNNGSFQVSEYKYNSATGALTLLSPAAVSTGASPLSGGITSDGQWVFVPNNGGSSVSGFSLKVATGTTPTGQLGVGTAVPLVGQPSAVLVQ
jgi:6-phosphogluconolactonase (cycloisomerase 2 family)